jgi:hypothetical protein
VGHAARMVEMTVLTKFCSEHLKRKDRLRDLDVDRDNIKTDRTKDVYKRCGLH